MGARYVRRMEVTIFIFLILSSFFACCNPDSPQVEVTPWTKHIITDTFNAKDLFTGDIDGDGKEEVVANDPMDKRMFSWFDHELVEESIDGLNTSSMTPIFPPIMS